MPRRIFIKDGGLTASNPTPAGFTVIGSDGGTPKKQVQSTISDMGRPYKVYTALLTQSGTNAPVAIVLENTIGNISWSYINPGYYHAVISDSTYPTDKTTITPPASCYTPNLPSGGSIDMYSVGLDSNTEIFLSTSILNGSTGVLTRQNNVIDPFYKAMIEIRVYN